MNGPNTLDDVPKGKVGEEVQGFVNFGAKKLEAERQEDGKWTIRVIESD